MIDLPFGNKEIFTFVDCKVTMFSISEISCFRVLSLTLDKTKNEVMISKIATALEMVITNWRIIERLNKIEHLIATC